MIQFKRIYIAILFFLSVVGMGVNVEAQSADVFALQLNNSIQFRAQSYDTQGITVSIFGRDGKPIYSASSPSNSLVWRMQDSSGQVVSKGIYLYVVTVRDSRGNLKSSGVKKLFVFR